MAGAMTLNSLQRSSSLSSRLLAKPVSATRPPRAFAPVHHRVHQKFAGRVQASQEGDLDVTSNLPDPDTARAAIAIGLKLTEAKKWTEAQAYFEKALELPGTGLKRFRDKPKQLSDGERIAIMYNIACCQAQLNEEENIQNGLIAIAGCLEAGYDNWQQLRTDPDLENLRKNQKFEGLMQRFEKKGSFGGFFKGF